MIDKIRTKTINISKSIEDTKKQLMNIIAKGDGLQCTGNKLVDTFHTSNVIFNAMRGGIFLNDYNFSYNDFINFIKGTNITVYKQNTDFFEKNKDIKSTIELKKKALYTNNADLIRLCYEYLPLSFLRRHGDPSRPWNKFSILHSNIKMDIVIIIVSRLRGGTL